MFRIEDVKFVELSYGFISVVGIAATSVFLVVTVRAGVVAPVIKLVVGVFTVNDKFIIFVYFVGLTTV